MRSGCVEHPFVAFQYQFSYPVFFILDGSALMDLLSLALCALMIVMCIGAAVYAYATWMRERLISDVRTGRFMSGIEFFSRWNGPLHSGFSDERIPGVVVVLVVDKRDSLGRPSKWSDAVVISTTDVCRTCRDQLNGRLDGEAYDAGHAMVSLTRRIGDAMAYAVPMARYYGASEVMRIDGRRIEHVPVVNRPHEGLSAEAEAALVQGL